MHKNNGFTLVEILVSAVIFALVLVGLMSVFVAGNKQLIHTRERTTSAELGKLFLDPLQSDVRQDTWEGSVLGEADGVPTPKATKNINNREFGERHTVSTVEGTDLRRVVSKITWTEPQS